MGSSPTIVNPTPPAPVSAGQSAAEFAAALPSILQAQLEFQPEFDRATFESFQELSPQFAQVSQDVLEQFSPQQAALPEALAEQALVGSEQGLPDELREEFKDTFKSLVGSNVESGIGADFVARNLLEQDLAFRQFNQNLALSLQNKVPITTAFQQPSQFQVANAFQPAFNTAQAGQTSFIGASRPFVNFGRSGFDNFATVAGGVGGLLQGVGSLGQLRG